MELMALMIGYLVMALAAFAAAVGLLYVCITWWEWNIMAPRMKFDGRGNITSKDNS